jgi:hypothetical protein
MPTTPLIRQWVTAFSNVFTISASSEYNSITTNKTYLQSVTSRTDFLGFDDGTRALPKGIYSAEQADKDIGYQKLV